MRLLIHALIPVDMCLLKEPQELSQIHILYLSDGLLPDGTKTLPEPLLTSH